MLKNISHICILLLLIAEAQAQKIIEKSWDASKFEAVEIISDDIFKIIITSKETATISLSTKIEGENYEQVLVDISEEKQPRTLTLSTGFTPFFEGANDKLAAHKVISIEMELIVPQNYSVLVRSALASARLEGSFREVRLDLEFGNCVLTSFYGDADINTTHGSIIVYAREGVTAQANTMRGMVKNELNLKGALQIRAQSVNGDITILPSQ